MFSLSDVKSGCELNLLWSTDWFENPELETKKLVDWLAVLIAARSEARSVLRIGLSWSSWNCRGPQLH
jgi:hypothetical protein